MILHVMNLSVKEEFVYRVVRRNALTVQFTVEGGWRRAGQRFSCRHQTYRFNILKYGA
jgi:hypothetical protein